VNSKTLAKATLKVAELPSQVAISNFLKMSSKKTFASSKAAFSIIKDNFVLLRSSLNYE